MKWMVVWLDHSDPQFNKCSPAMPKKEAKRMFKVLQGRYLVKIKRTMTPQIYIWGRKVG